jgi:hypothetical protein
MFTVESLRQDPALVKAFTGVPAEEFWAAVAELTERWSAYQRQRQAAGGAASGPWRCAWRWC